MKKKLAAAQRKDRDARTIGFRVRDSEGYYHSPKCLELGDGAARPLIDAREDAAPMPRDVAMLVLADARKYWEPSRLTIGLVRVLRKPAQPSDALAAAIARAEKAEASEAESIEQRRLATGALGAAEERAKAYHGDAQRLESERDRLRSALASEEKVAAGHNARVAALNEDLARALKERDALRTELAAAKAERERLKKALDVRDADVARVLICVGAEDIDDALSKINRDKVTVPWAARTMDGCVHEMILRDTRGTIVATIVYASGNWHCTIAASAGGLYRVRKNTKDEAVASICMELTRRGWTVTCETISDSAQAENESLAVVYCNAKHEGNFAVTHNHVQQAIPKVRAIAAVVRAVMREGEK